eukprot:34497-Rhodomonas_salina.5
MSAIDNMARARLPFRYLQGQQPRVRRLPLPTPVPGRLSLAALVPDSGCLARRTLRVVARAISVPTAQRRGLAPRAVWRSLRLAGDHSSQRAPGLTLTLTPTILDVCCQVCGG